MVMAEIGRRCRAVGQPFPSEKKMRRAVECAIDFAPERPGELCVFRTVNEAYTVDRVAYGLWGRNMWPTPSGGGEHPPLHVSAPPATHPSIETESVLKPPLPAMLCPSFSLPPSLGVGVTSTGVASTDGASAGVFAPASVTVAPPRPAAHPTIAALEVRSHGVASTTALDSRTGRRVTQGRAGGGDAREPRRCAPPHGTGLWARDGGARGADDPDRPPRVRHGGAARGGHRARHLALHRAPWRGRGD
eukprot:7385968-Prymnesium_polylepis.1